MGGACSVALGMKINLSGGYGKSNLGHITENLRKLSQKYVKYVKYATRLQSRLSATLEQIKNY